MSTKFSIPKKNVDKNFKISMKNSIKTKLNPNILYVQNSNVIFYNRKKYKISTKYSVNTKF